MTLESEDLGSDLFSDIYLYNHKLPGPQFTHMWNEGGLRLMANKVPSRNRYEILWALDTHTHIYTHTFIYTLRGIRWLIASAQL